MLNINLKTIEGLSFSANDPNITYTVIGYGQDPTSGANYIVGSCWDQAANRSTLRTFLLKDVKLTGQVTIPQV